MYDVYGVDMMNNERVVKQKVNESLDKIKQKYGQLFGMGKYIFYSSTGQNKSAMKAEKRHFDADGFDNFS